MAAGVEINYIKNNDDWWWWYTVPGMVYRKIQSSLVTQARKSELESQSKQSHTERKSNTIVFREQNLKHTLCDLSSESRCPLFVLSFHPATLCASSLLPTPFALWLINKQRNSSAMIAEFGLPDINNSMIHAQSHTHTHTHTHTP